MKSKVFLVGILLAVFACGCSNSNDSMTEMDKEFNEYAYDAAEQFLEQEAYENIETGELEYRYTIYNAELDVYEVGYLAEFNEKDHTEKQWIEIFVELAGSTKSVEDVSSAYWDETSYEMNYDTFFGGRQDKDGEWKNINLIEN